MLSVIIISGTLLQCNSLTDPELPIPLSDTLENTGAYLRVLKVNSAVFDMSNVSQAKYEFVGELQDVNNGANIDRVDFYVAYKSIRSVDIEESDTPVASYSRNSFSVMESGLPGATFSIYLTDIINNLEISIDSLEFYGSMRIRWEVILNDGKSFTDTDASYLIQNYFIYNSPYFAIVPFVGSIPLNTFRGEYEITQLNPGSDIFGSTILFGRGNTNEDSTFIVRFDVDPSNPSSGRIAYDVCYLPMFGCFNFDLQLLFFRENYGDAVYASTWVTVPGSIDPAVGCSSLGLIFEAITDKNKSGFQATDDSSFEFILLDNKHSDCEGVPTEVRFTAVKK